VLLDILTLITDVASDAYDADARHLLVALAQDAMRAAEAVVL
jgi:hypothetical protein